jgi:predicted amidohydrolase
MAVVAGMEEREGEKVYNCAVFIGKDGKILRKHRKINELDIAKVYSKGDSLGVFDFEGIKTGLDICADSWGPEITDTLYLMGARLIFSPSAWAVQPGKEQPNIQWISNTYRKRTKNRNLTIVTADSVGPVTDGPWKGRILQGESLITRRGKTLLQGPRNREALLTYKIGL